MIRAALFLFLPREPKTSRQSLYPLGTFIGQADLRGPDPFNILPNCEMLADTLLAEQPLQWGLGTLMTQY
jgi:hypothetical protein